MSTPAHRSLTWGRAHLPSGAAAYCCLCRQSFRSVIAYEHHRDMDLPAALRKCISSTPTETDGLKGKYSV